ncbi:MAG: ABC transporter permease [Gemmatimonadaceae bacterium]|nr:ABC transporter permease [Gemmatimonadaceae bacterium]
MPSWLDDLGNDARLALRSMRRAPLFATLVIGILALGIGASTTVWALLDGIVLRPLAYPNADRLFSITERSPSGGQRPPSYPTFRDWKARATAFDRLAYVRGEDLSLPEPEGTRRILSAYVSEDFFGALGVAAARGRTFAAPAGDERPIVLSWRLWQQRFGGDPSAIGQSIATANGTFTIVGVMPATFNEPAWADTWTPIELLPARSRFVLEQRTLHVDAQVTARLAPGVTREQGDSQMHSIVQAMALEYPEDAAQWTQVALTGIMDIVLGDARARLRVLALVVALVLLVTTLNAAGLMVARDAARRRELAVRTALGARGGRLARQLLVESSLLAALGGAAGIATATAMLGAIRRWAPAVFPRLGEVQLDARAMLFVLAVVAVVAVILGLLPARSALRTQLAGALRHGTAGSGEARASTRLRGALVVVQVALAVVVAVSAGLLGRTLTVLGATPLGVEPEGVQVLRVFPPPGKYDTPEGAVALYRQLEQSLKAIPGVAQVGLVNHAPFAGAFIFTTVRTDAPPATDGSDVAVYRTASPGYLAALGGQLVRGRFISDEDLTSVGSGVVVNEAFVRRFASGTDGIGKVVTVTRMAQGRSDMGTPVTAPIVGVIADERLFGVDQPPPPAVYVPYTWNVWPSIFVAIRSTMPEASLTPLIRAAVLSVDPAIPVAGSSPQTSIRPLALYLEALLQARRVSAWSLSAFSLMTLLLAAVGIFGVMAFLVVQRTREIGLRLALGATPGSVSRWVLWQTVRLALLGVVIGSVVAVGWSRALVGQLVGVTTTDPTVYVGAAALFSLAALMAGIIPAVRAARVDPVNMLRTD